MKFIKKLLFLLLVPMLFMGCESTNDVRAASFTDITASGSADFTIKVAMQSDDRVNKKAVDIQVRASKECELETWEENKNKVTITFDDKKWKSLTTLMLTEPDTEDFDIYEDVQSKTFIFNSGEEVNLTFRVVVGEKLENASKKGYILSNSKEISDEFTLKINRVKRWVDKRVISMI